MADSNPTPPVTDLGGLAKLADTELAKNVYHDGLQRTVAEAGLLAGDLTKTVRIALQPLFTAIQGSASRLNSWIDDAVSKVPSERRISAKSELLNAAVAAIGVAEDNSELRANYVTLLASIMDRDRAGDAHPAFPRLLQELSSSDALLFQMIPGHNSILLPIGLTTPTYFFQPELIQALEKLDGDGLPDKRQRFLVRVMRVLRASTTFTHSGSPVFRELEHAGFLEIIPSTPIPFSNASIMWGNLERQGLVVNAQPEHSPQGLSFEYLGGERRARDQLLKLLEPHHNVTPIYRTTICTDWGKKFARCCVPDYEGETKWHAV